MNGLTWFPCSCLVDSQKIVSWQPMQIIECHWCGATFGLGDLRRWLSTHLQSLNFVSVKRLIHSEGKIFEFVGSCGCGSMWGKETGNEESTHLPSTAQLLRD